MNPSLQERVTAYLEERGWEYYPGDEYTDDSWLLPGRIQFDGDDATFRALQWQVRQEAKDAGE